MGLQVHIAYVFHSAANQDDRGRGRYRTAATNGDVDAQDPGHAHFPHDLPVRAWDPNPAR